MPCGVFPEARLHLRKARHGGMPRAMFRGPMTATHRRAAVEEKVQLWLLEKQHAETLYRLIDANRAHLDTAKQRRH